VRIAKVEPIPEPEPKPETVIAKVEPIPEPKPEPKPEPVIAKVEPKPEPVIAKVEPKPEPVVTEPTIPKVDRQSSNLFLKNLECFPLDGLIWKQKGSCFSRTMEILLIV
jgi:hypothetical protein